MTGTVATKSSTLMFTTTPLLNIKLTVAPAWFVPVMVVSCSLALMMLSVATGLIVGAGGITAALTAPGKTCKTT